MQSSGKRGSLTCPPTIFALFMMAYTRRDKGRPWFIVVHPKFFSAATCSHRLQYRGIERSDPRQKLLLCSTRDPPHTTYNQIRDYRKCRGVTPPTAVRRGKPARPLATGTKKERTFPFSFRACQVCVAGGLLQHALYPAQGSGSQRLSDLPLRYAAQRLGTAETERPGGRGG